jgi:hypothetical protein
MVKIGVMKMKEVILDKILSLFLVILTIGAGYLTSIYFQNGISYYLNQYPLMKFIPVVLIAWIVLGRCGWNIQTWTGDSIPETFDKWFFRTFYILSFYLLTLFFFVEHLKNKM